MRDPDPADPDPADPDSADLYRLRRWEGAGATWRLVHRTGDAVTIALCTCDGGEEVDRFTSQDPELLSYVAQDPGD